MFKCSESSESFRKKYIFCGRPLSAEQGKCFCGVFFSSFYFSVFFLISIHYCPATPSLSFGLSVLKRSIDLYGIEEMARGHDGEGDY